ncbi:hypothetical protein EMCRGX_G018974 [Ephydatia muelleri]
MRVVWKKTHYKAKPRSQHIPYSWSGHYRGGQAVGVTWNGQTVKNNSLVSLSAVQSRVNATTSLAQAPLVCQGITGGQWYDPSGVLFRLATTDPVTFGGYGQRNVSGGVALYRGGPAVFPHGVQCCTNTTITLCVGMYSDLTLAASVNLATQNGYNYGLSVAATYGPNITGGVQFQLLTPTNVDPPVFQLTCTSTSSPPTDVLWTTNGSPVSNTSSQIVTDRPTCTYNNTLTVTGRAYGMYTCTVTTTCSPVCGGFTLNPRSTTSSLTVQAPPGPPTGVTAVQSGPTSVSVSWTAPTSGGPVTRYDIYYVANGGPSTSGGSTNSNPYVLTNLQVGVQYNISVIAVGIYFGSQNASSVVVPALGQVTITGSVTTPTAGSPYTLNCTVPVIGWNGTLTIQLTAPNGSMLISNVSSVSPGMNYTHQWPFSPLRTSDGGQYSCVVSSPGLTSVMTSSVINVTIPSPRAVITSTSTLPAHLGDNVNLTCDIQLDPSVDIPVTVVTTWFGPGGSLQDDVDTMISPMEYQSTLMLTSLKAEQAGNYTCSTKVNGTYVVPLTLNSITQVSIHVISITSLSTPLVAGQNYTLYCNGSVLGNLSLTPMVMWSNSNGVVTNGNDITVSNGILKLNPLHTLHGGQYTCQTALSSPVTSIITSVINVTVQIPPPTVTITSTPITTSYYAGTPLNLTCTVQLIPQVDTTVIFNSLWTGPGGQISSGVGRVSLSSGVNQTTVQFYPLNTTDTGVYNCSVSVSAAGQQYVDTSIAVSSSMTSITVKALPAPKVTITPSGSSTAGSPYNLTCTVMVVNGLVVVPQMMWFKNGVNVAVGNSTSFASGVVSANTTTLTLQFNPLYTSNGGQYSCIANISLPVISITSLYTRSYSNVTVQVPPPTVTLTSTPITTSYYAGTPLNLTCTVQLIPQVDTNVIFNSLWTGPGGQISSGVGRVSLSSGVNQTTVQFYPLNTTDTGVYNCSVSVSASGQQYVDTSIAVSSSITSITVKALPAPQVTITPSGSSTAGSPYNLTCTVMVVNGLVVVPLVMWFKNGVNVAVGNSISFASGVVSANTTTLTLQFNPLYTSNGGQYSCIANVSLPAISITSLYTRSYSNVTVQVPPPTVTLTSTPITTSYYAGTPLNLTCTVQLIPQVDTNVIFNSLWTGPGGQISSGVGRVSLSSGVNQTTVQFYPLNTTDTGVYNCSVSVSASGQQYVDTSIAVSSSITSITVKALPAPQVTITPSGSSTAGSPYNLTCTVMVVNGLVVVPQVMWFKNGVNLAVGNSISFASGVVSANTTTLTLQFNPLYTSNGGQYSCIANVSLPVISITSLYNTSAASVIVQIPQPIINITAVALSQVIAIGSNITLTCNIQLDPSVDSNVTVNRTWTGPAGTTLSGSAPNKNGSIYQTTLSLISLKTTDVGIYTCSMTVSAVVPEFIVQTTVSGTIQGPTRTASTSSSASATVAPSVAPGSSMVTGAIAGAVIGGILSVLLVVAVILIIMTLRSKRKGRLSIGVNSLDMSIKKGKSQDMELMSINVTENVSYERVHVPEDRVISHDASIKKGNTELMSINVSYERVHVPEDHVIYDTITDGAVDLKRPHPPPANEGDMYIEAEIPPYSNLLSPSLPLPAFNSSVLPPSLPSPSYHHPPVLSSSPLSSPPPYSTPSTLPLQSGLPQPPFHHHTQPISVVSFHDHVHTKHMNGNKGFQSEYHQLSDVKPEGASQTVASLACNARKNRFGNIVPCDENRVKLKETPGVPGSDYINASLIDNLCKQYWADEEGGVYDTDTLCITTTAVMTLADYNIRRLEVKSKVVEDLDVLQVAHYQYTSWPDDEVPQFATSFLNFVRRVQKVHDKSKGVPLLVHCSTGVGRTGTFIALDTLLDRMRSETSISVFEVVKDMRRRRVLLIQTQAQYVFIHDALDEYITCGDTSISVTNLRVSINSLSKTKSGKTINGFQEQFSLLDMVSRRPSPDECSDGAQPYNKAKNRYQNKLPYNASRPLLTTTGTEGSDYINASFVDGYKQCKGYIATQGPLQNTVEDFWRMVWEFKCRVIIMMCPLTEKGHESSYCYWPTEEEMAVSYGSISVTLQSQLLYDGYEVRTFNIRHKSEEQDTVVTQLHYTEWPENGRPPNTASMVGLMDTLTRTQMSTGNKPIVVHCNDGVGRTGTFITMHSELERLKAEGALDVFERVKLCRIARPGLVQNVVTITPSGSSTAGSPYNLTCTVMVVNGLVVVPQVMWFKNGVNALEWSPPPLFHYMYSLGGTRTRTRG